MTSIYKTTFRLIAILLFTFPAHAHAQVALEELSTLGGVSSEAMSVNGDGTVVVGYSRNAGGNNRAFRWENGIMEDLGTLGLALTSRAFGVSADGTVIAGDSNNRAFHWEGGVMTDLGTLGGNSSAAFGISADGTTIVGQARIPGNADRAFRWRVGTGMENLGTLGGGASYGYGANADGTVVVGDSTNGGGQINAFRWVEGVGMANLGTLGGATSSAYRVSGDGTIVVGRSLNALNQQRAFRWEGGLMEDLGTLGGTTSTAIRISTDGSTIVGQASNGVFNEAFRWRDDPDGMVSLSSLLTAAGVDMTNITLTVAEGVNEDGEYITGVGTFNGFTRAFLFGPDGLITPEELVIALQGTRSAGQQTRTALTQGIGHSLLAARQAIPYFSGRNQIRNTGRNSPYTYNEAPRRN